MCSDSDSDVASDFAPKFARDYVIPYFPVWGGSVVGRRIGMGIGSDAAVHYTLWNVLFEFDKE